MKKLMFLSVLVALCAGLIRHSPHYSVYSLGQALQRGDAAQVERFVELGALASVPAELITAGLTNSDTPGGIGAAIGSALSGILGTVSQIFGGPLTAMGLREKISKKELTSFFGFEATGVSLLSGIQMTEQGALVTLNGTCAAKAGTRLPATLVFIFDKIPGPVFGFPATYRTKGLEGQSLKAFAQQCQFTP
jgi:Protein of unknown function (DUF2939)